MKGARHDAGLIHMDVQKILLLPLTILSLAACSQKTSNDVFTERSLSNSCTNRKIEGQYLVRWEDGRLTLEKGGDTESFVRDFIEPNLENIRHVEFNKRIQVKQNYQEAAPDFEAQAASSTWGQVMIEARAVWTAGAQGLDVPVAVVDTPVDYTHTLLRNRVLQAPDGSYGWDFSENAPAQPAVLASHGSHVAGIISSDHTAITKLGIAPKAKIIIGSFLGDDGGGSLDGAIQALNYVQARGAKIVNASWGGPDCSISLRETIQRLSDSGMIVVVASGNDGHDLDQSPDYPAVFQSPHQITVAAIRDNGQMEAFSNTSYRYVQIAAPGVDIYSTIARNSLGYMSGTSMAAPFVSGAAAVLWGHRPSATAAQIKAAILDSVDLGTYRVSTQGRLNLRKAVAEIERLVPAPIPTP